MVYQIYYGDDRPRQVLFDIEIYLAIDEAAWDKENKKYATEKKWYVEMHSSSFISGVINYIRDKQPLYTEDEWEQFRKDCEELEELRGWLWETHDGQNRPRLQEEANKDYRNWRGYIQNKIYFFAHKYGLYVNED